MLAKYKVFKILGTCSNQCDWKLGCHFNLVVLCIVLQKIVLLVLSSLAFRYQWYKSYMLRAAFVQWSVSFVKNHSISIVSICWNFYYAPWSKLLGAVVRLHTLQYPEPSTLYRSESCWLLSRLFFSSVFITLYCFYATSSEIQRQLTWRQIGDVLLAN